MPSTEITDSHGACFFFCSENSLFGWSGSSTSADFGGEATGRLLRFLTENFTHSAPDFAVGDLVIHSKGSDEPIEVLELDTEHGGVVIKNSCGYREEISQYDCTKVFSEYKVGDILVAVGFKYVPHVNGHLAIVEDVIAGEIHVKWLTLDLAKTGVALTFKTPAADERFDHYNPEGNK